MNIYRNNIDSKINNNVCQNPIDNENASDDEDEKHKVLIVEDDKNNQNFIKKQLEEHNFVCTTAESVDEAFYEIELAHKEGHKFEVIFLDLILKDDKTGIDFLKERVERGYDNTGIVVVMSGNQDASKVNECHSYNIQNYVKKPVNKTNLYNDIIKIKNSLKDLKCPIKGYRIEKKLGEGASGEVFLVTDKKTKTYYAMKKVLQDDRTTSETAYMKSIKAPTILELKDCKSIKNYNYMIIEYAEFGTLCDLLNNLKEKKQSIIAPNPDDIILWITEALLGLYVIHEKNLIHRDIKPDNLFICKNNILKIGDLGIAKAIKEGAFTVCGTHHYMAPEIHKNEFYDAKVDIWALGIVLYEIVMLKKPFDGDTNNIIDKVLYMEYDQFPKTCDHRLSKILKLMLIPDRVKRPSAKQLLQNNSYIKEKLQYIVDNKLFAIEEEIVLKLIYDDEEYFNENNNEETNDKQSNIISNINYRKEEHKKINMYKEQFNSALILDINSIKKASYQKSYFSQKHENVVSGSDMQMCASDFEISEENIKLLIKSGFIYCVSDNSLNPNLTLNENNESNDVEDEIEFDDSNQTFYKIKILEDSNIKNSTFFPYWFQPKNKNYLKLTQDCLENAICLYEKLIDDSVECIKDELLKLREYNDFLIEIKLIKDIKFNSIKNKKEKLAIILNIYQIMFIHYYVCIEINSDYTSLNDNNKGLINKVKGLVYYNSSNKDFRYKLDEYDYSLYELKNIVIRKNKKPFDAYFKLVNDNDGKAKIVDFKDNNKLLFVCLDPIEENILDFNIQFCFSKFSENVDSELEEYLKCFVEENVQIDESSVVIPKFTKNYLSDFSNSEADLVKLLYKYKSDTGIKITSLVKNINNKSLEIIYE